MNSNRLNFSGMPFFAVLLLFVSSLFISCSKGGVEMRTYHHKKYFAMEVSDLRAIQIKSSLPHKIEVAGKIYVYGNYLFINEPGIGIHIINNANPYSPKAISFIGIPGNEDMAVTDNVLYADNFIDLLAFDISKPENVKLLKRVENVFPGSYTYQGKALFTAYKDTVVTEPVNNNPSILWDSFLSSSSKGPGQGGSMARFTIMNNHLYTVHNFDLRLFNVDQPADPKFVTNVQLGRGGIETIFPYQDKLFIGSTSGMIIYDASIPASPKHLSTYSHFTSCDPVVVDGKYAYVTLRSGNFCTRGLNQLDVLNIEDPAKPVLLKTYPMQNPHGLGISGKNLFICEGEFGFKSFDISDVTKIDKFLLQHLSTINAKDVIAGPKSLIVTGEDGVFQYNYSNPAHLSLLSKIKVSSQ